MTKCAECGIESKTNKECEYCHKTFCEKHMPEHQAWEHRHETLAEDESRLWKKRERQ
jgi:predicted nucleic acid binding AN1-type Zn finger protein